MSKKKPKKKDQHKDGRQLKRLKRKGNESWQRPYPRQFDQKADHGKVKRKKPRGHLIAGLGKKGGQKNCCRIGTPTQKSGLES